MIERHTHIIYCTTYLFYTQPRYFNRLFPVRLHKVIKNLQKTDVYRKSYKRLAQHSG
jgi:hypothetical protein